jgi:beta-galactosidase GanA
MDTSFPDNAAFYPCGVHYHRAPTPLPSEWESDLKEIARCGYTHVQYRPQWRWHERLRGAPTWDDLDRLFDLAADSKLRVVLKPMLETAPDWAFSELGGTRIGFHGVPISPFAHGAYYVGGWWPCFDNPGVVAAAGEFVYKLVSRYSKHPALWLYNAWNEPRSRPVGSCQCQHSVASYRQWLRRRFGSVEALNEHFGKAWTSIDTVLPPQAADDYAEMFLWRQWAAFSVAGQVEFVVKAIRKADGAANIFMHVGCPAAMQDPIWDVSDDFQNASKVQRYGTSFGVPMHPRTPLEQSSPEFTSDWVRRIDPSYWCNEFYSNEHNWSLPPTPRNIRRQLWMGIAGGAGGFTHWQWRSERVGCEVNGAGMREIDGSPTARSAACDEAADVLRKHGAVLAQARRPRAQVALFYSQASNMIMRLQEMKDWTVGIEHEPSYPRMAYTSAIRAAHSLYLHSGLDVDFVVSGDDVSEYKVLHVTCAEMIDAATARWLRQYVRDGGTLIVEFPFACRDDNTWVSVRRPSNGLEDMLGCAEAERLILDPQCPSEAQFEDGTRIEPAMWRVMLAPTTAKTLATWPDGRPAATVNTFGRGKVISLGINLSLCASQHWTEAKVDLFARLVRLSTLEIPQGRPLWVRRRVGPAGEVWFVFNVHEEPGRLDLPRTPRQVWIGGGTLAGARLTLPPGEVWVAQMR